MQARGADGGHRARAGPRVRRAETCGVMSAIIITTGFDANDKVSDPPGNNNLEGCPFAARGDDVRHAQRPVHPCFPPFHPSKHP